MATNHTTLIQDIQDWLENDATEFTDNIDTFIRLAEERIARDLDARGHAQFRTSAALTVADTASASSALPSDFLRARYLRIQSGAFLLRKDETFIYEIDPSATAGTPKYYAEVGTADIESGATSFVVAPASSGGHTLDLGYVNRPSPLTASNATSWLTNNAEDLLLRACLLEGAIFMQMDDGDLQTHATTYNDALGSLLKEQKLRRDSDDYRKGERVENAGNSGV